MRLSLALLCFLASCGGGGGSSEPCPLNTSVYVTLVPDSQLPGVVGDCDRCRGDGSTYIRIQDDLERVIMIRTIAHELGHAAGLLHAYDANTDCLMNQGLGLTLDYPCAAEMSQMLSNIGNLTFSVSVSPAIYDNAVQAANLWNTSGGRVIFVIL